jgi:ubiquinol-cytochrome c reductase cytochrome b subunit
MTHSNQEKKWNQWLAGVIDGDGYLAIQKSNHVAVCEITMPLKDEKLLAQIKQKLGGQIRLRSGAKAVRYRLGHQQGIKDLINRINGSIRNSQRIPQLQRLCKKFDILFIPASPLTLNDGYSAGFFDAGGMISLSVHCRLPEYATQKGVFGKMNRLYYSRGANQLTLAIGNKYHHNLVIFYDAFQFGKIRKVTQKTKQWYRWELNSEFEIFRFCDYLRHFPCHSSKKHRLFLIRRYFELKALKAHLAPKETNLHQAWFLFCQKWYQS